MANAELLRTRPARATPRAPTVVLRVLIRDICITPGGVHHGCGANRTEDFSGPISNPGGIAWLSSTPWICLESWLPARQIHPDTNPGSDLWSNQCGASVNRNGESERTGRSGR